MKKKKKMTLKEKILNILKSHKTIIYISFFINIVLLIVSYNLMTSNHQYTFEGNDKYISIKNGLIVINNDLNTFYGNDLEYINDTDYEVTKLTLGYYVSDNLKEIISKTFIFDESIKLSEVIDKFTHFNNIEKSNTSTMFTQDSVKLLNDGLYFVLKAITIDNNIIKCKIKLNMTKISKF